jgi:hypothetical protein
MTEDVAMKLATVVLAAGLAAMALSGCATTPAERGALIGGATGAAVGGITTGTWGGAAVGGAIGAGAGYLIGKHSYRCERVNIFGKRYLGWCLR